VLLFRSIAFMRRHPVAARIRRFDQDADRTLDRFRSPTLDHVFFPLSSAADHSVLWAVIGWVRQASGRAPRGSANRLIGILAVESVVTNVAIKSLFKRIRPELEEARLLGSLPYGLRRPVTSAFPSGHATSAFTAAAYLSKGSKVAPIYYGLATAVSVSRVYVRLHHASDVIGGAVIGIAFGRIARRLAPT
jgi:undecaprenyl-diphosphatase